MNIACATASSSPGVASCGTGSTSGNVTAIAPKASLSLSTRAVPAGGALPKGDGSARRRVHDERHDPRTEPTRHSGPRMERWWKTESLAMKALGAAGRDHLLSLRDETTSCVSWPCAFQQALAGDRVIADRSLTIDPNCAQLTITPSVTALAFAEHGSSHAPASDERFAYERVIHLAQVRWGCAGGWQGLPGLVCRAAGVVP